MRKCIAIALLSLTACQPSAPEPANNIQAEVRDVATEVAPSNTTNAAEQAAPPGDATPADETSAAAAAKLVERYADLIERGRFDEALKLWGDSAQGEAEFAALDKYATIDATVGRPGDTEGAAGSIYVDVPLTLSGTLKSGGGYRVSGQISLRRVNDVPGSTAKQRRWHIYASGLKPAA